MCWQVRAGCSVVLKVRVKCEDDKRVYENSGHDLLGALTALEIDRVNAVGCLPSML